MIRVLLRRAPTIVTATLVVAGVLLFADVDATLATRIYVLLVGALVLLTLVGATEFAASPEPSAFERALARGGRHRARPGELERLERQVALSVQNAFDFHIRLRPAVREAAGAALWHRHGVDLDASPERARALVPAELWDVVRPDVEPPEDRHAPGPSLARIDVLVTEIERMSR
ncbi:MAG TPA: hypothetical protein VGQ84_02005 [Gaiellaceae bacterium]|nr:hypothetical protein [Gaiellaceae bacterium]